MKPFAGLILFLISLAQVSWADCHGEDLRYTLTEEEEAELDATMRHVSFSEGNRWIAERDGKIVHLIGTVHIDDPRMAGPLARLDPVIRSAGHLLVEMDKRSEADLKSAIATNPAMLLLDGTSLPDMMEPEEWQTLALAAEARGIPPFMAARFQPWYLSVLMSLPPCMMSDLQDANGLDQQIMDVAAQAGVPISALEPSDTIFTVFNLAPLDTQIDMLVASAMDRYFSEDMMATVLNTYFEERPGLTWELSRILSRRYSGMPKKEADAVFDKLEDTLLNRRNMAWIPVILNHLDRQPLVVAFGAAHLIGRDGVPALLERQGFTVRRVPF